MCVFKKTTIDFIQNDLLETQSSKLSNIWFFMKFLHRKSIRHTYIKQQHHVIVNFLPSATT